jgi:hypothetical protein
LASGAIPLPVDQLGAVINRLISDVGKLHYVSKGDLHIFGANAATAPSSIEVAMRWGTKIFDAIYYFSMEPAERPAHSPGVDGMANLSAAILLAKKRLLWTAMFLMLRGSYPSAATSALGTDVPAFLVNIAGMNESPRQTAEGLASFNLQNISTEWVRSITWSGLAPEIRQRLALGLAGYRMLGPFKIYEVRPDAPANVKAAADWVRHVTMEAPDYSILSATRSPVMIAKLGSWNKALGNLILLAFTDAQINEMVSNKILFQRPVRDPRADNWVSWVADGHLQLTDPIAL